MTAQEMQLIVQGVQLLIAVTPELVSLIRDQVEAGKATAAGKTKEETLAMLDGIGTSESWGDLPPHPGDTV